MTWNTYKHGENCQFQSHGLHMGELQTRRYDLNWAVCQASA